MPVQEAMAYPELTNADANLAQLPNPNLASYPVSPQRPLNGRV